MKFGIFVSLAEYGILEVLFILDLCQFDKKIQINKNIISLWQIYMSLKVFLCGKVKFSEMEN